MTEKCFHDENAVKAAYDTDAPYLCTVRENFHRVVYNVENTCARLGIRYPVKVVAATKTVSPRVINYAALLGLKYMGENRVQEFLAKEEYLEKGLEKHFIGTLQRNKVKYLIGKIALIHSVDNVSLAAEISQRAEAAGYVQDILIELNIGRELGKSGVMPENIDETFDMISKLHGVRVCGIMTIAPHCRKKDDYRKFFAETYQILLDMTAKKMHNIDVPLLSMGMSDNYELALEYGANIIRPGTAIFGKRLYNISNESNFS